MLEMPLVLLDGFSGIIGYVSYDSTDENAVNWGFVDLTGANPTLDIEIVLGGLTFTEDMDADTPNYPFGELNDLLDPCQVSAIWRLYWKTHLATA